MKNNFKYLLLAGCIIFTFRSFAQKVFSEGQITYKMTMMGDGANDPMAKSMMENAQIMQYIKGDKSRMTMDFGMMKNSIITYADNKKGNMLMEMMGQKYNITLTENDVKQQESKAGKYTIQQTDETKQICGYNCKKAIIKMEDGTNCNVFYTKDLVYKNPKMDYSKYDKLGGFPMEYEVSQKNNKMKYTITKIEEKPVDNSIFNIPSDYKPMTMDEYKQMTGGNGGMGGF